MKSRRSSNAGPILVTFFLFLSEIKGQRGLKMFVVKYRSFYSFFRDILRVKIINVYIETFQAPSYVHIETRKEEEEQEHYERVNFFS